MLVKFQKIRTFLCQNRICDRYAAFQESFSGRSENDIAPLGGIRSFEPSLNMFLPNWNDW